MKNDKQKTTPKKQIITGYKATDKDIRCRDYQFEVGKWHKHEGDLELCVSGFHFCEQPSGVWSYHNSEGTRVWKIEAKEVLVAPREPGADYKLVCRQIRLVEEVKIDGDYNTGYRNTGNCNTGDYNTGYRNTGNYNTGYYNTTNFSAGYFCAQEPTVICFDVDTGMNRNAFRRSYGDTADRLGDALMQDEPIVFDEYKALPGITPEKLLALHSKLIEARLSKAGEE